MKKFLLTLILSLCTLTAFSQRVALITNEYGYYHIYNSQPREYRSIPANGMTLVDYSSELIIFKQSDYYLIYNSVPARIAKVPVEVIGKVVKVFDGPSSSDGGFISDRGGKFYYLWNRDATKHKLIKKWETSK